jgi:hypothetical protein
VIVLRGSGYCMAMSEGSLQNYFTFRRALLDLCRTDKPSNASSITVESRRRVGKEKKITKDDRAVLAKAHRGLDQHRFESQSDTSIKNL